MVQNELLKNERFIGALSRSAQNTLVPLALSTPSVPHFSPQRRQQRNIFPVKSEEKKRKHRRIARHRRDTGIIPIMNTILSNVAREGNLPGAAA